VAGEARADHARIAVATIVLAVDLDLPLTPSDLRRAAAFIGEGSQHQPVHAFGVSLRESGGADRARGGAVEVHLCPTGFARHHRNGGVYIFDPGGGVGIGARASGLAVAGVVPRTDVAGVAREQVHERVLALARHGEIVGGARRIRGAVHQEQNGKRSLARLRRANAFAPEVERNIALLGPIFGAPDRAFARLRRSRAGGLRLRGEGRRKSGTEAEACSFEDGAPRERLLGGQPTIVHNARRFRHPRAGGGLPRALGLSGQPWARSYQEAAGLGRRRAAIYAWANLPQRKPSPARARFASRLPTIGSTGR